MRLAILAAAVILAGCGNVHAQSQYDAHKDHWSSINFPFSAEIMIHWLQDGDKPWKNDIWTVTYDDALETAGDCGTGYAVVHIRGTNRWEYSEKIESQFGECGSGGDMVKITGWRVEKEGK
jgi:hypothetical protein